MATAALERSKRFGPYRMTCDPLRLRLVEGAFFYFAIRCSFVALLTPCYDFIFDKVRPIPSCQ